MSYDNMSSQSQTQGMKKKEKKKKLSPIKWSDSCKEGTWIGPLLLNWKNCYKKKRKEKKN